MVRSGKAEKAKPRRGRPPKAEAKPREKTTRSSSRCAGGKSTAKKGRGR